MTDKEKAKKHTGNGCHRGGRPATGIKRVTINISGQPEEIKKLKENAAAAGLNVSRYILENLAK